MNLVNDDEQSALEILASLANADQPPGGQAPGRQGATAARGGRSPGSGIKTSIPPRADEKNENFAPMKWVQCSLCARWRQVPYTLSDEDIPEDWRCSDNTWDPSHNSCRVAQAYTDRQIDEMMANQEKQGQGGFLNAAPMELGDDDDVRRSVIPQGEPESPARNGRGRSRHAFAPEGRAGTKAGRLPGARGGVGGRRGATGVRARPPVGTSGRGRARGMKTMNDAAEALLGMNSHEIDEAEQDVDEGGAESEPPAERLTHPPSASSLKYPPGTAVWAKVEGHDWWPAKVVRRRAVPREVGPPPGGPHNVHNQIPVVFFTANGIPSEKNIAEPPTGVRTGEVEEAEYAWLVSDCMKSFTPGESVPAGGDQNLQACIEAAGQAVAEANRKALLRAKAAGSDNPPAYLTDSDGGWGLPSVPPEATVVSRPRGGKGRGRGGRRGRGKGTRRGGRGNRRSREEDMEDSDSEGNGNGAAADNDPTATPASVSKIVVEQIWAWRWPLSEAEKAAEKVKDAKQHAKGEQNLKSLQEKGEAAPAPSCIPTAAASQDKANQSALLSEVKEQTLPPSPFKQAQAAELGAPDALTSFLEGSRPDPGSSPQSGDKDQEPEYLVKYSGRAHIHDEWVSETLLMKIAKRKCINFKRRYSEPCNLIDPDWMVPERFVARRCAPAGPGWEMLVKWKSQNYENCTWEMEGEGMLVKPQYMHLHQQLWKRQKDALHRASSDADLAFKNAVNKGRKFSPDMAQQPTYITDKATMFPHQLEAVDWLKKQYLKGQPAILASEAGLGKTASVVVFLQFLRHEFKANSPVLIVLPQASLPFWEGELQFWAGDDCNVVSYTGTNAARSLIHDHELWLQNDSLDEKTSYNTSHNPPSKIVKADVVLAAHETVGSDSSLLSAISWNVIVMDERKRVRSALAKAFSSTKSLECRQRLLLTHTDLTAANTAALLKMVTFVKPEMQDLDDVAKDFENLTEDQQVSSLLGHLSPLTMRRLQSDVENRVPSKVEIQMPVSFSPDQAEFYKQVLSRFYDVLADPKTHRLSSSRASQSKVICDELRKVVSHPFVIPELAPEKDTAADRLAASGKLPVLEKMMKNLQATGRRALLLSHDPSVLEILEEHLQEQFGKECVERIDDTTPSTERFESIQRFKQKDGKACLFMQTVGCCGLGTDLPNVAVVIIHDSDWNPRADMQAINRCRKVGSRQPGIPTLRLFITASVEEKLMLMSENVAGMDAVYAAGGGTRSLGSSAPLMEQILRWGTQDLFQPRHDSEDTKKAVQSDTASDPAGVAEGTSALRTDPKNATLLAYEDEALNTLLEKAIQNGVALEESTESVDSNELFGPGLERVTVHAWQDSKDVAENEEEYGEEFNEDDGDDDGGEGDGSEPMLGATYWANLLGGYAGDLKGTTEGLDRKPSRKRNRTEKAAAAFADSSDRNSDAEDGEEVNTNALEYGKASYGQADALDALVGDEAGRRASRGGRGGRNGGRGTRGTRRRRAEIDDDDASDNPDGREKRIKRGQDTYGYSPETDQILDELLRHESVLTAASDPTTSEGKIVMQACSRLEEIVVEAELDSEHLDFATQAARIMLLTRERSNSISDFEEYTLLALVAVAGSYLGPGPNGKGSLDALIQRYNINSQPVRQVYDFIRSNLHKYRLFNKKANAMKEGRLDLNQGHLDQDGALSRGQHPDMEVFGSRLSQIVATDFTDAALQSPLDPTQYAAGLPFVSPDLERNNPHLAKEFELVQDQLQDLTSQIALKDRVHNIRVKHIQEEYQNFMEKVRSKAQQGIDLANSVFQGERQELTTQVDMLVHLIHTRYLLALSNGNNQNAEVDQRVGKARPGEGSSQANYSRPQESSRINGQELQSNLNTDNEALQKHQMHESSSMNQISRALANNGHAAADLRAQNGGLASMAVQSAAQFASQQQPAAGLSAMEQQHSLPLQRLTDEQVADVQLKISNTPQQQSPVLPSNPQPDQSFDMNSMLPSFFANTSKDQENMQRIANLQQEYVRLAHSQQKQPQQAGSGVAFDPSRGQAEEQTGNTPQPAAQGSTSFFVSRPMQIVTSRPPPVDQGNWEKRSASSRSTPSRSPSPRKESQQPPERSSHLLPLLPGKPIMQAHGQRVQEGTSMLRPEQPSAGLAEEHTARQAGQARQAELEAQNAALGGSHYGHPVDSSFLHRFPPQGGMRGWGNAPQMVQSQRMLPPTGEQSKEGMMSLSQGPSLAAVRGAGWPIDLSHARMGHDGQPILSSQTITSGGGALGPLSQGMVQAFAHQGRPVQAPLRPADPQRAPDHQKHSHQDDAAK